MPIATPQQTFARIEAAHTAWKSGSAAISISLEAGGKTQKAEFDFRQDGKGGIDLRLKVGPQNGYDATDQAFVLRGSQAVGIDYRAREALGRPAPAKGAVAMRLYAVIGQVDDSIGFLTDAATRARYLNPLKALNDWRVTPTGLLRKTTGKGKASFTQIDLDASGRVSHLRIDFPGSKLEWKIRYAPYRPLVLPKGYRVVEAFTARPLPPKYEDAQSRQIVNRMLTQAGQLKYGIARIDNGGVLWIAGSKIRYENDGTGFAFDGRNLTVRTRGANYRGVCRRYEVIDKVAMLLGTVDPLARSFLVRSLPFQEIFTPLSKVRSVGTMELDGKQCDLISVETSTYHASLFIRRDLGLPVSVEGKSKDRSGQTMTTTTRTIAWSSIGKPLTGAIFELRLPAGQRPFSLPSTKTAQATAP